MIVEIVIIMAVVFLIGFVCGIYAEQRDKRHLPIKERVRYTGPLPPTHVNCRSSLVRLDDPNYPPDFVDNILDGIHHCDEDPCPYEDHEPPIPPDYSEAVIREVEKGGDPIEIHCGSI